MDNSEHAFSSWYFIQESRWIYPVCKNCNTMENTPRLYCPECGCIMVNGKASPNLKYEKRNKND